MQIDPTQFDSRNLINYVARYFKERQEVLTWDGVSKASVGDFEFTFKVDASYNLISVLFDDKQKAAILAVYSPLRGWMVVEPQKPCPTCGLVGEDCLSYSDTSLEEELDKKLNRWLKLPSRGIILP